MANHKDSHTGDPGVTNAEFKIHAALLRSEIGFWREMIETSEEIETADDVDRMRSALALAETKLGQLVELNQVSLPQKPRNPSNVVCMRQARKRFRPFHG